MANRQELTDAILHLCDSQDMCDYALAGALIHLDLVELAAVFDAVADHHSLLTDHIRPTLAAGVDVDLRTMTVHERPAGDEAPRL